MNSFLKKLSIFSTLFCSALLILHFSLNCFYEHVLFHNKINQYYKSVFIGDSQVQLAINQNLLIEGINLAQTAEPIKFSYYKIYFLLKRSSSIKKIYLGCGYHNFSSATDDYTYGENSIYTSSRYFFIFPFKEKFFLFKNNLKEFPQFFKQILSNDFKNFFTRKENLLILGGYQNNFKNVSAAEVSMNKRLIEHYYDHGTLRNFSYVNINYLNKIVRLCEKHNIELTLIRLPVHPYYKNRVPHKFVSKYNEIIKNSNIKTIEFDNLPLSNNCFTPDGDHVSQYGASLVTKEILIHN